MCVAGLKSAPALLVLTGTARIVVVMIALTMFVAWRQAAGDRRAGIQRAKGTDAATA